MIPSTPKNIAIIGAGMTGITAATILQDQGFSPVIYEKSSGIGGRMATRHSRDGYTFDHGAQFITARTEGFEKLLAEATQSGIATQWRPTDKTGWVIGTPTMNDLLKPMAAPLKIHFQTQISAITRTDDKWHLTIDDNPEPALADIVISTVPAPQAEKLVSTQIGLTEVLRHVDIMPCWALMLAFDSPFEPGFQAQRFQDNDITWISRENAKPGRDQDKDCWVVHASPAWSTKNLESDPETIIDMMLKKLAALTATKLPPRAYVKAHRWRYAQTATPLAQPFLSTTDKTLFIGGDWSLGARVECAYLSGKAIATAILQDAHATQPETVNQ